MGVPPPPGVRVSSLSEFLLKIDEYDCEGFCELINHAAKEIADGPAYLHSRGIAHRDLKPANVLIRNQHYCTLSDDDENLRQYECRPIACKLTDFGESCSLLVQTQSFLASKTNKIDRGTVVYMAPEILVEEMLISGATISDLFLVDVWALGMIFFNGQSQPYPFRSEVISDGRISNQEELKKFVRSLLSQRKHPLPDKKYEVERATVWSGLEDVYRGCVNFDRHSRLLLKEAVRIMSADNDGFSRDLDVVHLNVSQSTAVEEFGERLAFQLRGNETEDPEQLETALTNEGTNACAFLSVKVADTILSEVLTGGEFFANLSEVVEDTIWHLLEELNGHRDLRQFYDAVEAYGILREREIVTSSEFSEELPFVDTVFSFEGRPKLYSKLYHLGCDDFVAVFASDLLVLTIGCRGGRA